jgi:rare lipoprotein A
MAEDSIGKRTASGEIYSMCKYTAAHRILPFGSIVRVTNLINDRGLFIKGRIIDLSYGGST